MNLTRENLRGVVKESVSKTPGADQPVVFKSDLDPTMNVVVVYPENERYGEVLPVFDQKGHAFLANDNIMVVDGGALGESWFTTDHLTVIQAHELGHKLAGHVGLSNHDNPHMEKEADWLGYNILKNRGMNAAANLHEEEYEARYGSLPSEDNHLMTHLEGYTK